MAFEVTSSIKSEVTRPLIVVTTNAASKTSNSGGLKVKEFTGLVGKCWFKSPSPHEVFGNAFTAKPISLLNHSPVVTMPESHEGFLNAFTAQEISLLNHSSGPTMPESCSYDGNNQKR